MATMTKTDAVIRLEEIRAQLEALGAEAMELICAVDSGADPLAKRAEAFWYEPFLSTVNGGGSGYGLQDTITEIDSYDAEDDDEG